MTFAPDSSSEISEFACEAGSKSAQKFANAAWLLFALILFAVQVLPYLSYRWVTDESWYTGPGYSIASGHGIADPEIGPNDIENRFDARPPGTAIIIATVFRLFGTSVISARLGSVLAGFLVFLLTYYLARDFADENAAIAATFLIATDNFLVLTSRTARPDALTTLAVVVTLVAVSRYAMKGRILWAFASGFFIALGTMFHVTLAGFLAALAILLILADWNAKRFPLRGALAYVVAFGLGLLPFGLRTEPFQAAYQYHAQYFITGDRVMNGGLAGDQQFYTRLRNEMGVITSRSRLVAIVSDPYYGELKIHELNLQC